ncbi:MAG: MFS transporter [Crenarchaeota archaeon]|nr:MFS transporter [Thermoproteota archaeon]
MGRRRGVWRAFVLLSLVSLFADMGYEAVRGVLGAYLASVGAPAWLVPLLALAEGLSYLGRLVGGFAVAAWPWLAWPLVYAGYGAVYALALVALVPVSLVVVLYVVERLGKGLRAPARDTLLSLLTEEIGHGRGFGLHEVFDQVGAVAGPVILGVLAASLGVRGAILFTAVPATLALACLAAAHHYYPYRVVEAMRRRGGAGAGAAELILFGAYAFTTAALLAYWPAVAYILGEAGESIEAVSFLYAGAMLVDAVAAMAVGELFDRAGVWAGAAAPLLAAASLLALRLNRLAGIVAWGVAMGSMEVLLRAVPAALLGPRGRARAYGVLGVSVAAGWWLVSMVLEARPPLSLLAVYAAVLLAASILSLGLLQRLCNR